MTTTNASFTAVETEPGGVWDLFPDTHVVGVCLKVGLAPRLLSPEYGCGGSVITKTKHSVGRKEYTQQVIDVWKMTMPETQLASCAAPGVRTYVPQTWHVVGTF